MKEYANSKRSCIQFPHVAPMAKLLDELEADYPTYKLGNPIFHLSPHIIINRLDRTKNGYKYKSIDKNTV